MASIRKRGDLQWEAQVRKKGQPAQSRTFSTRADADRWAKETEIAIERGLFFDRSIAERTTINELIDKYREVVRRAVDRQNQCVVVAAQLHVRRQYTRLQADGVGVPRRGIVLSDGVLA